MDHTVDILDVTIRDGSYAIGYQYTPQQVEDIVREIDRAGIPYIEVSHGCGLGARDMGLPAAASDEEYVAAAKRAAHRAKIGVIANMAPFTKREHLDAVLDAVDFIRFAANVDNVRALEQHIAHVRARGNVEIFVQMMRSSRRPLPDILEAGRIAASLGAHAVYLVDTAGFYLPEDVHTRIAALTSELTVKIGFHAHDNLRMGLANTLAAIDAGATLVDASLRGMGRAGGNASLEALVAILRRRGLAPSIDLDVVLDAGEALVAPLMPAAHGIEAIDIVTADANIDLYPLTFFGKLADALKTDLYTLARTCARSDATEIGMVEIMQIIRDFKKEPKEVFEAMGLELPKEPE